MCDVGVTPEGVDKSQLTLKGSMNGWRCAPKVSGQAHSIGANQVLSFLPRMVQSMSHGLQLLVFQWPRVSLSLDLGPSKVGVDVQKQKNSTAGPFAFLQLSHLSVQLPTQRISCNSGDAGRRPGASWDASGA